MKKHILLAFVAILAIGIQGCSVEEEDFSIPSEKSFSPILITDQDNTLSDPKRSLDIDVFYPKNMDETTRNLGKTIILSKVLNTRAFSGKEIFHCVIEQELNIIVNENPSESLQTILDEIGKPTGKINAKIISSNSNEEDISKTIEGKLIISSKIDGFIFEAYLVDNEFKICGDNLQG